ncbi:hypothetical protein BGZ80_001541 [Entomortierella chlamydospora]|uniref:50s ribosomal protein l12 n=1 Tax=Entomortierella chlamydospora TaxID=101097 RepID=A0A9P6MRJ5_9FUNG|nr:hypothetical protein BGZ80_001541 [Entomortierella chlamydospora]
MVMTNGEVEEHISEIILLYQDDRPGNDKNESDQQDYSPPPLSHHGQSASSAQSTVGYLNLRTVSVRLATRNISRIAPRVAVSRVANYSSAATDKLDAPGSGKDIDPKIVSIVDQISGLTLLQTADLVSLLKTRLNIQEIAMPVGGAPAGGAPAAAAAAPIEVEKVAEKTEFNVKLEKFDAAAKAKLIREIKNIIPGINLVEAKKFVESAPKVVKENLSKADAEKLKKTLEDMGATVSLE